MHARDFEIGTAIGTCVQLVVPFSAHQIGNGAVVAAPREVMLWNNLLRSNVRPPDAIVNLSDC